MTSRVLIRDVCVISMESPAGVLAEASVLVEGGLISHIGDDPGVACDIVVDGQGKVLLPGFIDAHRHLWYEPVRAAFMDAVFGDLLTKLFPAVARRMQPDDLYDATRGGLLAALDRGVTTVFDWCHALESREHVEAAVLAHESMPSRAVLGVGGSLRRRVGVERAPLARLQMDAIRELVPRTGERLGFALALESPDLVGVDGVADGIALARDLSVMASMHIGTPVGPPRHSVRHLAQHGLLGPEIQVVHACTTTAEEFRLLSDSGAHLVVCPSAEILLGSGVPPVALAREAGLDLAFGTDAVVVGSADPIAEARMGLAIGRLQRLEHLARGGGGPTDAGALGMTTWDALAGVTCHAAAAVGLADHIGTITVGKQADLVTVRREGDGDALATGSDPVSALVGAGSGLLVEDVFVAGHPVKLEGRFVHLDADLMRDRVALVRRRLGPF